MEIEIRSQGNGRIWLKLLVKTPFFSQPVMRIGLELNDPAMCVWANSPNWATSQTGRTQEQNSSSRNGDHARLS